MCVYIVLDSLVFVVCVVHFLFFLLVIFLNINF